MTDQFNFGEHPHRYGIARRGHDDSWAVLNGGTGWDTAEVLNRDGQWEWEPRPSERTEDFVARTRFPFDEAKALVDELLEDDSSQDGKI
ncbi:hypothetical protein CcI49_23085 [Frankia sp. CcI49]|uniref:hypothetical protein n=1 Tax=Frankia sp. CcI49 TaxID=1745382 RepID=UPI0009758536|nr:hypothetical protein [Frankia sp. CcI49]ONH58342.1 hypothetical protein CcI49_23085 [Frankia sp. CcI49]